MAPYAPYVLLAAPDMNRNLYLADVRPRLVGQLDGAPFVAFGEPLAVGPVGAERKPERLGRPALVDVGRLSLFQRGRDRWQLYQDAPRRSVAAGEDGRALVDRHPPQILSDEWKRRRPGYGGSM